MKCPECETKLEEKTVIHRGGQILVCPKCVHAQRPEETIVTEDLWNKKHPTREERIMLMLQANA